MKYLAQATLCKTAKTSATTPSSIYEIRCSIRLSYGRRIAKPICRSGIAKSSAKQTPSATNVECRISLEQRHTSRGRWKSDSEALLEALRVSSYRHTRPREFNALFGYILANRDGADNWHNIPSPLRRSLGGRLAPVRSGSGVIEKNIEVRVGRRFKRQGRSCTLPGAEHLAQ